MTSSRLPPVSDTASGMHRPSVRMGCLLPGRARSTGLSPLSGPAGPPARGKSRSPPSTSPAASPTAASSAAPGAASPTRRPPSRPPGAASRSHPSRNPAPGAGTPTGSRCAARTESPTTPAGPAPAARHQPRPRPGQQQLHERPQSVRPDPQPRLTLPHDPTNKQTSRRSLDQQLPLGPLREHLITVHADVSGMPVSIRQVGADSPVSSRDILLAITQWIIARDLCGRAS